MTRERLVEEKRRLIRIQSAALKASRNLDFAALTDAVAQLTLTVSAILKEHEEK